MPTASAVIVAAGRSSRMGGVDKTFAPLLDAPLIAHTVERFDSHSDIGEVVLVLAAESVVRGRELASVREWRKVAQVCAGGERRQDSVYNGLLALAPCDLVLVHDGARPCVDDDTLTRGIQAAMEHGAAVAGMPVKDTIKHVTPELLIEDTPERSRLWAAQTPQVFRYDLLMRAHHECQSDVTDDAAMVESLGHQVRMYEGTYENIKVTTAGDLTIAEVFLRRMLGSSVPSDAGTGSPLG